MIESHDRGGVNFRTHPHRFIYFTTFWTNLRFVRHILFNSNLYFKTIESWHSFKMERLLYGRIWIIVSSVSPSFWATVMQFFNQSHIVDVSCSLAISRTIDPFGWFDADSGVMVLRKQSRPPSQPDWWAIYLESFLL